MAKIAIVAAVLIIATAAAGVAVQCAGKHQDKERH